MYSYTRNEKKFDTFMCDKQKFQRDTCFFPYIYSILHRCFFLYSFNSCHSSKPKNHTLDAKMSLFFFGLVRLDVCLSLLKCVFVCVCVRESL